VNKVRIYSVLDFFANLTYIEIDGEIFVNDTDFDNLMQAEGTNLPLIELQDQNLNPTVDE
jgi:hypothetical protein